eukprot:Anaeramoba_ignava/a219085_251.p1 GENE.a219085_251~~a219085_251.p1  ORF type:complete len:168 (+),score=53.93 a219085_251:353-856(+)
MKETSNVSTKTKDQEKTLTSKTQQENLAQQTTPTSIIPPNILQELDSYYRIDLNEPTESPALNEEEIIQNFLMQPLNMNEKINRKNPSFGVIIYLYIKNNIRTHKKKSNLPSKYQLPQKVNSSFVRKGKCPRELAEWIVRSGYLNEFKDVEKKKKKKRAKRKAEDEN